MMFLTDHGGNKMSATEKEKLSLGVTVKNAWYAMTLASQICPGIIVHSFFLWLLTGMMVHFPENS